MSKFNLQRSPASSSPHLFFLIRILLLSVLFLCTLWSLLETWPIMSPSFLTPKSNNCSTASQSINQTDDPQEPTFYDDPELTYTIEKPIKNWDEKRKQWLKHHPSFVSGIENRILLLTGSQPSPCKNTIGDHLLLRCFKNKVDYCRIHGYDIFYNNACLHPKLCNVWAKLSLIRAAMVAHPESEWLWWMDSDAIFTDMDFKVPLQRYKEHNFVVHGWPDMIYEKKSWVSVNAGSFLIRNCQWSMDFLEVWSSMGPQNPNYKRWSDILTNTLSDRMFFDADEQSGLIYLLLKEKEKWGHMIYVENRYSLHGYWVEKVGKMEKISRRYEEVEKREERLRRRKAEVVKESNGKLWEEKLKGVGEDGGDGWRRPFITHFTGCQPCSGKHNPSYRENSCWIAMEKALNFADNQVLRSYGFVHDELRKGSNVSPLTFDFPSDEIEELA